MKSKMPVHIHPGEIAARSAQEQVQKEIESFLQAVDSYPAQVAKEPRVSFRQHLCSIFSARNHAVRCNSDDSDNDGRDTK